MSFDDEQVEGARDLAAKFLISYQRNKVSAGQARRERNQTRAQCRKLTQTIDNQTAEIRALRAERDSLLRLLRIAESRNR